MLEEVCTMRPEADDDASHVMSDRGCVWSIKAGGCTFADPITSPLRSLVNLQLTSPQASSAPFPLHSSRAQTHGRSSHCSEFCMEKPSWQLYPAVIEQTANIVVTYQHHCYLIIIQLRKKKLADQPIPALDHWTAGQLACRHLRTLLTDKSKRHSYRTFDVPPSWSKPQRRLQAPVILTVTAVTCRVMTRILLTPPRASWWASDAKSWIKCKRHH